MKRETIERYSPYLFDLVEDVSSINMNADVSAQVKKLKDRAIYLIYCMNEEDKR